MNTTTDTTNDITKELLEIRHLSGVSWILIGLSSGTVYKKSDSMAELKSFASRTHRHNPAIGVWNPYPRYSKRPRKVLLPSNVEAELVNAEEFPHTGEIVKTLATLTGGRVHSPYSEFSTLTARLTPDGAGTYWQIYTWGIDPVISATRRDGNAMEHGEDHIVVFFPSVEDFIAHVNSDDFHAAVTDRPADGVGKITVLISPHWEEMLAVVEEANADADA